MSRKKYTNPFYAKVSYDYGVFSDEIRVQRFQTMQQAEKKAEEFKIVIIKGTLVYE